MTTGAQHAFAFILVVMLLLVAGTLLFSARQVGALRDSVRTQCQFARDLGDVAASPVMVNPATHKASKVGIAIIADSRLVFHGLGCPGTLTKPGLSYLHWARYWKLPAG
jgi:hypothetical protein